MPLPTWKVLLLNRTSGDALGEFTQYSSASYVKKLNANGNASMTISLDDPISRLIDPLATMLSFERNGITVWSGPISTREDSVPSRTVTIQASGLFDVVMHRVFRNFRNVFTQVDAGQIAAAILAEANAQSDTGIRITSIDATTLRTRAYQRYSSMGEAITAMSQVENGYDFEVVGTEMRIYTQQGVDRSASAAPGVHPVVLGFQSAAQNIATFSRRVDTTTLTNRLNIITVGSIETIQDTDSVNLYGLYETTEDLATVSSSTGRAYGAAEVAVRGLPMETIDVSLIPVDEEERSPRFDGNPFNDANFFGLGDTVRVIIQDPGLPLIDSGFRVFGATVSLDANGLERVTGLQLAGPLRSDISLTGFPDVGGLYTPGLAGNPSAATSYVSATGYPYTVTSLPYVNVPAGQTWIVGDPLFSVLGFTTILT